MIDQWEKLTGRDAPEALISFAEKPDATLAAILSGVGDPDLLAPGPASVIGHWLGPLPRGSALADAIDGAVASRLRREWNPDEDPDEHLRTLLLIDLFDIVSASSGKLPNSVSFLLERFGEHDEALAPWSSSPSHDPLGRYLLAVARNQLDRRLASYWFNVCRLPASVPLFRAEYGLAGLRGLPKPENPDDEFPHEVAKGLRLLADAVRVGVEDGRFDPEEGKATLLELAQIAIAAYPLSGWESALLNEIDRQAPLAADYLHEMAKLDERALSQKALEKVLNRGMAVGQGAGAEEVHRSAQKRRPSLGHLLKGVRKGDQEAVRNLQEVLDEQVQAAERSGEFGNQLGMTLTRASLAARSPFPQEAVSWSQEALRWEPWEARSWTAATAALRVCGQTQRALDTSWKAQARFPFNHFVWVEVGLALKALGRASAAEVIFMEAIERFPADAPPLSAYAELLLETGRPEESVALLEPAVERLAEADEIPPNAGNLWAGLTAALISMGNEKKALEVATRARELLPENRWAKQMPQKFEKFARERHRRDASSRRMREREEKRDRDDEQALFSVVSEVRVLRQAARRGSASGSRIGEAKRLIEQNRDRGRRDPLFVAELMGVHTDLGRPDRALDERDNTPLHEAVDPNIGLASAQAKRKEVEMGSPEDALGRFSQQEARRLTSDFDAAATAYPALHPVKLMVDVQAASVMVDGSLLDAERSRRYGRFRDWIRGVEERTVELPRPETAEEIQFERDWAEAMQPVWAEVPDDAAGTKIALRAGENAVALDRLSEDFVRRLAVLT